MGENKDEGRLIIVFRRLLKTSESITELFAPETPVGIRHLEIRFRFPFRSFPPIDLHSILTNHSLKIKLIWLSVFLLLPGHPSHQKYLNTS